jgi:hypothetical protein
LATSRRLLSRLSDRYAGTRTRTVTAAAADQVAIIITAVPPDGAVSAARAQQTIGQAFSDGYRALSIIRPVCRAPFPLGLRRW